jgi:ribonuclease BN (tRNA processing enzyme)
MKDSHEVSVTFLGCGDAFGSGGRFHTCFLVRAPDTCFLVDCGASALITMKKHGVETIDVDAILITHFHGDHFGGVPFFLLDAQHIAARTEPLVIAGPHGIRNRVSAAAEALFPGSSGIQPRFPIEFVELAAGTATRVGSIVVSAESVVHSDGANAHALRIECAGRTIAYSGDTEWTESLVRIASGADLFVCECSEYDQEARHHLDYQTLLRRRYDLDCRRMILTHMGDQVLSRLDSLEIEYAADGKVVTL